MPAEPSDRWRRPLLVKTDDEGRFKLPTEPGPAAVLVLHDSGVKELSYDQFVNRLKWFLIVGEKSKASYVGRTSQAWTRK